MVSVDKKDGTLLASCEKCGKEKKIDSIFDLFEEEWRMLLGNSGLHCLCTSCSDKIDAGSFKEMVGVTP